MGRYRQREKKMLQGLWKQQLKTFSRNVSFKNWMFYTHLRSWASVKKLMWFVFDDAARSRTLKKLDYPPFGGLWTVPAQASIGGQYKPETPVPVKLKLRLLPVLVSPFILLPPFLYRNKSGFVWQKKRLASRSGVHIIKITQLASCRDYERLEMWCALNRLWVKWVELCQTSHRF